MFKFRYSNVWDVYCLICSYGFGTNYIKRDRFQIYYIYLHETFRLKKNFLVSKMIKIQTSSVFYYFLNHPIFCANSFAFSWLRINILVPDLFASLASCTHSLSTLHALNWKQFPFICLFLALTSIFVLLLVGFQHKTVIYNFFPPNLKANFTLYTIRVYLNCGHSQLQVLNK